MLTVVLLLLIVVLPLLIVLYLLLIVFTLLLTVSGSLVQVQSCPDNYFSFELRLKAPMGTAYVRIKTHLTIAAAITIFRSET